MKLSDLEKEGKKYRYRGRLWTPNKPVPSDREGKKMMVLATKNGEVKLIHFGQDGYRHNYSAEAKKNYLTRSAGIRDKDGNLTKNDPWSPNYWARKVLWPKGEADGKAKKMDESPIVKARKRGESPAYVDGMKEVCCAKCAKTGGSCG